MELLARAAAAAGVVILIQLISRTRSYYIAGLVPLFPTLALITHYVVGVERSVRELRKTILMGMLALIPYSVYLVSLYVLVGRVRLGYALGGATVCWLIVAVILVAVWQRMIA
ncbi:MAG: GlpM family protein [Anaerolineae bacterium]